MTDLYAIVKATRASASALARMQHAGRAIVDARDSVIARDAAKAAYDRARCDYARAQSVLAANPLPGDEI